MANLQLRDLSEELHEELRKVAARERTTMSEVVLRAIEHELARKAWLGSFTRHRPTELGGRAAELLEEARAERER